MRRRERTRRYIGTMCSSHLCFCMRFKRMRLSVRWSGAASALGPSPRPGAVSSVPTASLRRPQTLLCRLIALAALLEPAAFDHFPRQSHCAYRLSAAGMVERVSVLNQVAVYTGHSQRLDHPGKENERLVGHCLSQARVLPRRAPLTRLAARSTAAPKVSPSTTSVVQCASTATLVAANAPPIARNTAVFLG